MTREQAEAVRMVAGLFIEAVKAGGEQGAPAGVIYSAVLDKLSLSQFESIMSGLVRAGKIRKSGNLYFFVADL